MTREKAIERLAESHSGQVLAAVLAKGYDDNTLSVITEQDQKNAKLFCDTQYAPETVDTLTKAYAEKIIESDDLLHIMRYSTFRNGNEVDVQRFIQRIKDGMGHKTATDIFVADNYEPEDFDTLADKVKSGAYFPTKYGTLSLSYEVAKVLFKLRVSLRASRKGRIPSGVLNVEDNIKYGDCIRGGSSELVLTIREYMNRNDWGGFYKYLSERSLENISAEDISSCYENYRTASNRAKVKR